MGTHCLPICPLMIPRYPFIFKKWSSAAFAKPNILGLHAFQLCHALGREKEKPHEGPK